VTLTFFLQAWFEGDAYWAKESADALSSDKGTKEYKAMRFLLDPRPLAEKEAELRQDFAKSLYLAEFIIGEHHLKNGNHKEALEAYRKSKETILALLRCGQLKRENWFARKVRARLNELTAVDKRATNETATEGGG
jgi:hypothetical protein